MPALRLLAACTQAAPQLPALGEGYLQAGRKLLLIPAIGLASLVLLVLPGSAGKRHNRSSLAGAAGLLDRLLP